MTVSAMDAACVRAAAGGDRAAFGQLVDATRRAVSTIALAIVRDLAASEDVAQEVYLAAWRGIAKLRNPDSFLPWLRQLTRHRANDWLRTRGRQRLAGGDHDPLLARAIDPALPAELALVDREEQRVLAEAIDGLPDDAREVVLLYYREGQSIEQVATLLELRPDAIKKRLSRARQALRDATLAKLSRVLAVTAPGPAFTQGVMTALPPAPASAGAAAAAGKAKLAAAIGGAAAQLGSVVIIALVQLRVLRRRAGDDTERRGIAQLLAFQVLAAALAIGGFVVAELTAYPLSVTWIVMVLFISAIAFEVFAWYPRIIARRLAAERAEDPIGAADRQRRQRTREIAGFAVGVACGCAGLVWRTFH